MQITKSKLREMIDDILTDDNLFEDEDAIEWALDLCNHINEMPEENQLQLLRKIASRLSFIYDNESEMPMYDLHAQLSELEFDTVLTDEQLEQLADLISIASGGDPAHDDYDAFLRDEEEEEDDDDDETFFEDEFEDEFDEEDDEF